MVIFPCQEATKWYFGSIFLKKYHLYWNPDQKMVKFYYDYSIKENKSKFLIVFRIIGEILLIILLVIISFYFGKKMNTKRKLRASELEDTYEYVEKSYFPYDKVDFLLGWHFLRG